MTRWSFTLLVLLAAAVAVGVQAAYKSPVGGTAGTSQTVCSSHWQSVGPFAVQHGATDPTDPEDIGAAHDIWVSGNSAYLATVNGGVWRSTTFHTYNSLGGPHWQPMTDQMPCLSMSSISGSADDANVVIAGCGFQSNALQRGGEAMGAMISLNAGATWSMTQFPAGYWVSSVLASGVGANALLLVAARAAVKPTAVTGSGSTDPYNVLTSTGGIWRSTDAGATFTSVFTTPVNRVVRHPTTSTTIYAVTLDKTTPVQMSTDGGATWTATAQQPPFASVCSGALMRNPQITVSSIGGVTTLVVGFYVSADLQDTSPCYALFYSTTINGASWNAINNLPAPTNGLGLGAQGFTNFAIYLAPTVANMLFVAGTGRAVLRTDITTSVWTLISQPVIDPPTDQPAYRGTASPETAPHSDARNFFWDATTGDLLLTNDGGIYKRTSPTAATTAGGWSSLAGDLSISEAYQVSVDPTTGAMIIAAQDNSLMTSQWDGTEATTGIWSFLLNADGTVTGFDSSTTPAQFYGANQALGGLLKASVLGGTTNALAYTTFSANAGACAMGDSTCFTFATTLAVNLITPSKSLVCTQPNTGSSVCYELTFSGTANAMADSTTQLSSAGAVATQYVYGGRKGGTDFPDVVFAVGSFYAWSRSAAGSNTLNTGAPWRNPVTWAFIAQHPRDYYINLVIDDGGHCWLTTDFGATWKDLNVNSNLQAISGHTSVDTFNTGAAIFVDISFGGVYPLVIGTSFGSFVTFNAPTSSSFTFSKLGVNQAKTIPTSYVYSAVTDTLTASLFGRGVWQIQSINAVLTATQAGTATSSISASCTTPLYPNVPGCFGYITPSSTASAAVAQSSSAAAVASSTAVAAASSSAMAVSSSAVAVVSSSAAAAAAAVSSSAAAMVSSTAAAAASSTAPAVASSTAPAAAAPASSSAAAAAAASSTAAASPPAAVSSSAPAAASLSSTGAAPAVAGSSSASQIGAPSSTASAPVVIPDSSSSTGSGGFPPASQQPEMVVDFPSSMVSGSYVDVTLRLPSQPSSAFTMTMSLSGGVASPSSLLFTADTGAQAWFRLHTFRFTAPSVSVEQSVFFQALYSSPEYLDLNRTIWITLAADLSSSTGVANANLTNVPALFPVLEVHFALGVRATAASPDALLQLMMSDTAALAGVDPSRLVQLAFVQEPGDILYRFSIAPPPLAGSGDISAQQAAANFVSLSGSPALQSYASYSYASQLALADTPQQTLATKLSQVTFSMNYNINALPGGPAAFEANLVRDIAAASKVANNSRIVLTSLVADPANPSGGVRATFLVTPVFIASEGDISPAVAIDNFLGASKDPSSTLFTGVVTSQTTAGSASITWPQAPAQDNSSDGFWTLKMIIIIAACGGGFLLLLLIISCVACRKKKPTSAGKKSTSPQPQSRKGFDSINVINDEPTTMKRGAKNGGGGNARPIEGGTSDAQGVELTQIRTDKSDPAAFPTPSAPAAAAGSSGAAASSSSRPSSGKDSAVDPEKAQAARVAAARATLETGEHVSPGVTSAKPAPPVAKVGAVPVRPSGSGRPAVRTHPMPAVAAAPQPAPQPASPPIRAHSPSPVVTHGVPTRPANARPTPIRAPSNSQSWSSQPGSGSPLASPSMNASSGPPIRSGLGSPSMGGAAYPPQRPPMQPQQSAVPVRPSNSSPQYAPQYAPSQYAPPPQQQAQWQQSDEGQPPAFQPQSGGPGAQPAGSGGFSPPIRGGGASFRIAYTAKKPANPSAIRRLPPPPQ